MLLPMDSNEKTKTKEEMSDDKKAKLIYSGELMVFGIVFVVLGILFLVGVIGMSDWKRIVFTYGTLVGGVLLTADFLWGLFSKKRRKRICLLDKILVLPVALALFGFDIYCLALQVNNDSLLSIIIGADFCYLAAVYLFESIYHWFYPVPGLLDEEEKKPEEGDKKIDEEEKSEKK